MIKYLIGAVLLVGVGYGLFEAWPLLAGPTLVVESPLDNTTFPDGVVSVRGRAIRAAQLTLDGAPLSYDQNGDFSSTLTFSLGGTILTFVATDRFGRTVTATRNIFVPTNKN